MRHGHDVSRHALWMAATELTGLIPSVSVVLTLGIGFVASFVRQFFGRSTDKDLDGERTRLRAEMLPYTQSSDSQLESALAAIVAGAEDSGEAKVGLPELREALNAAEHAEAVAREAGDSVSENGQFAPLLIEYYAYGLTQAKRSLAASLAYSALGGLVLMGGVLLALLHPKGGPTVPAITSLSGVLSSAIGTLFHRQATQSLKHMEGQSRSLRQDMKAERDQHQAVGLLNEVEDVDLRSRLQAALVLQLTGAKLPDTAPRAPRATKASTAPRQRADSNGQAVSAG
jgi:hypothetical protein